MVQRMQISPDVLFRELEGEAVLLDLKSQRYFGLDAMGTRIWRLLEELGRPEAVLEALLGEYDVSRGRLEGDLRSFLDGLREAGLIHPEEEPVSEASLPQGSERGPQPP